MRIIVGDPHGCLTELERLVERVGYVQGRDSLTIVGDVLDRGPNAVGVVAFCMSVGAYTLRGNHEEKALRWLAHEARARREPGYVNPMNVVDTDPSPRAARPASKPGTRELGPEALAIRAARAAERANRPVQRAATPRKPHVRRPIPEAFKADWRALTEAQVQYLEQASTYIDLARDWYVVHAGVESKPFNEQRPDRIMRIRYVDPKTGEWAPSPDGSLQQPPGSVWWMEMWEGPENIIYGHAVHSLEHPRIDVRQTKNGTVRCFGIDTGCCFGGRLTAMVFDDDEMRSEPRFVQVQAERTYMPLPGGGVVS